MNDCLVTLTLVFSAALTSITMLTSITIRKAAAILLLMLLLTAPAIPQTVPLAAHVQTEPVEALEVEEERSRTCAKVHEWTERFHCIYEFTVLARRVREFPNYSGVEPKEDVRRDIELTFEKLKRQFATRG